jgi:hypothetical protein
LLILVAPYAQHMHTDWTDISFAVERDGIAGHERAVGEIVSAARRAGLDIVSLAVLADRREPAVARTRALGRVLLALDSLPARQGYVTAA